MTGAVVREDGRLLAIRRSDDGAWELPGGVLELDESAEQGTAASRRRMSREEALPLVQRLLTGDLAGEAEGDEIVDALERGLGCPHISGYIYWDMDPDLSAERIVDRALAYRPIAH
ncbi:NUDIX domain-containing protein [Streptomyces sp. NBC_01617]|uniref:NUDIX domain-containing protein n=1 Tax=unclassified Streptomyces TaxID=2593676 RepID=UPI003863AEBB